MSNAMDQSSVSAQTSVRSQDLLAELSSSAIASAGIVQSLEERHSGSLITPFQLSVNMTLGNGQLTNRSAPLQQANSSIFPSLLFKPSGSCIDQNPFANDHSNSSSLVISSGITEYIVKENDGGEGCSLDGSRLYYKRKTPEDEQLGARLVLALEVAPVMHQPSSVAASGLGAGARPSHIHQTIVEENDGGEGCSLNVRRLYYKKRAPKHKQLGVGRVLALEAAPVMHQPSNVAASGLGAGVGLSDIYQTIGVAGEAQHSQRNIRLRRASEDEQLGLLFKPSGSRINQNPFANDPTNSNSLVIYSGIAEYILGARCVLALEAAPITHQPSSVVASGLEAGVGPSDIHQTIGVAGEAQHSQRNICLRRAPEDEQLGLLFKPTGSCTDQNPFANDPSNSSSLVISSGIAEYLVEENDGGEGFSLDGKHLYCKRRAPEDEQLDIGLVLALEAALVMHQPSSVAASGLGAGSGPSNIHQP
ncbi:hypothetical protein GH714_032397 [Hevea brasiliensis]|uniref:Uncharacterized protein n=1 Tax=Hevea brasiliensis TaxID=3981 RepID=A0A6A6L1Q3_HEVBR|nr:hypothetical protein GH714_032397 [Hevea brasiliensis]